MTKKTSFIYILIFALAIIYDSTIVKFFSYSGVEFNTLTNVAIFVGLSSVFAVGAVVMLNSVKNNIAYSNKFILKIRYFYLIYFSQFAVIGIIATIIIEITFSNKYSIFLLHALSFLTHISALTYMIPLVLMFAGWLKSKSSHIVLLYTVSFALISANVIVSLIYLESFFYRASLIEIRPHAIHFSVVALNTTQWTEVLSSVFDILAVSSFLSIWIATIILLYQYRLRLGKIKYFMIMSIPLIYYLFPFGDYFGNILSPLSLNSPVTFGIVYVLTFSSTKQVGAVLFSLAFLTASDLVTNDRVKKSLLISSVGMVLLISSIDIETLPYKILPPYGLVTEAFIPLGSYLLFVGMFSSVTNISKDAEIRKELFRSAKDQLSLLKNIGSTQMEKELLKKCRPMIDRYKKIDNIDSYQLEEQEVKEIVHDVLKEIQSAEGKVAKGNYRKDQ